MATTLYSKKSIGNQSERGFTLAELLIVVAIIAVLTAIAIPVFTSQLEKSREATDFANVRSAYAELMASAITDNLNSPLKQADGTFEITVSPLKQRVDGWSTNIDEMDIGGVPSDKWSGSPVADGSCKVTFDPVTDKVGIIWSGEAATSGGGNGGDSTGDSGGNESSSGNGALSGLDYSITDETNGAPPADNLILTVGSVTWISSTGDKNWDTPVFYASDSNLGRNAHENEIVKIASDEGYTYYKCRGTGWLVWNSNSETWDQHSPNS